MTEPFKTFTPKLDVVPVKSDEPQARVGLITGEKRGILEWPAAPDGDKGPRGVAGRPWRIVGYVSAEASLPTGLGPADAGKAWANTTDKSVHVWQGYRWHPPVPTGLSRPGDAGAPALISIGTVTTTAPGTDATQALSGTAPNKTLDLSMPRGADGDKGPTSSHRILNAVDYTGYAPTEGQQLGYSGEGFVSLPGSGYIPRWSISEAEFDTSEKPGGGPYVATPLGDGNSQATITEGPLIMLSTELYPSPVPYRPECRGLLTYADPQSSSPPQNDGIVMARLKASVTIDFGEGARLIGSGQSSRFQEHRAMPGKCAIAPATTLKQTPDSMAGVVPAGVTAVVECVITRTMANRYNWPWKLTTGYGMGLQIVGWPV